MLYKRITFTTSKQRNTNFLILFIMKYIVIKGIFEGTIFNGKEKDGRILNIDTSGQSYPLENCIKYDYLIEVLLKESKERLLNFNYIAKIILEVCYFEHVKYYFKIDFKESKTEKEVIKQMLNYLNNEGFENYKNL